MENATAVTGKHLLEALGLDKQAIARWNLSDKELYDEALNRKEGTLTDKGALAVLTGSYTGRSPQDKFIVRDSESEKTIWWDSNKPMSEAHFAQLHEDFSRHSSGKELFASDLFGGADPAHRICVRVISEFAWHALFISYLLRQPEASELAGFTPNLTIVNLPSFKADPDRHGCRSQTIIAVCLSQGLVLIGNTEYGGETKKAVFGALNYFMPAKGVMPMHCSASIGKDGDSALLFGLSGTGKTTLSSDGNRTLIGDDEHGWSEDGIFNFEGGCYAKTIGLSQEAEPEIYAATQRRGSILENVVVDLHTGVPDFDDASITENGRVAYPMHFIANSCKTGIGPHPKNVIMLTADAFGVMAPIARLMPGQAIYHFLSGYTAKVAGTEKGVCGVQATFSTCFGAPFMPRHPIVYGNLLRDMIIRHEVSCWLINTGWTGGAYGTGSRMPIAATRAMLNAALEGHLDGAAMRLDPFFGFEVPLTIEGVDDSLLAPRDNWADSAAYDEQASKLVKMFQENFCKFEEYVDPEVIATAPIIPGTLS